MKNLYQKPVTTNWVEGCDEFRVATSCREEILGKGFCFEEDGCDELAWLVETAHLSKPYRAVRHS